MEFLVFLLIAIFVIVSGKGSGQKKPAAKPTAKLRDRMEQLRQQAEAALEPNRVETPRPAPVPRPVPVQGVSRADDEGCVGGSMKHTHTEGETREEHRRHLAELHKREAEELQASEMARELSEMNLQKLRRAVVMAEVLGKPASMKKRRNY